MVKIEVLKFNSNFQVNAYSSFAYDLYVYNHQYVIIQIYNLIFWLITMRDFR